MSRSLFLLLLLATSLKLAILLAPGAGLYFHGDPVMHILHPEEIHRGNTAIDLMEGLLLPLADYQYAHFFGGSQVVSLLAVPFFWIFGPCVFALKCTGLIFNGLMVAFVFLILDRLSGRRAAWIGGLLASLPAPGYVALTLTAFGTHVEHNALSMGILYLYLIAFQIRDGGEAQEPKLGLVFLLGIACGFGVYFGYIILITLLLLALHRAISSPAFFKSRGFGLLLMGFFLGLVPWLEYNIGHDFKGIWIYGSQPEALNALIGERIGAMPGRLQEILGRFFPSSAFFQDLGPLAASGVNRLFIGLLVLLALLASRRVLVSASDGQGTRMSLLRSPLAIFVGYPIVFFAVASASQLMEREQLDEVVFHRYFYVLYPYLFLCAGLGVERLWRRAGALRAVGIGSCAVLLILGVLGSAVLVDSSNWGVALDAQGYSREQLGRFFALKYQDEPQRIAQALEASEFWGDQRERHQLYFGVGIHYQKRAWKGAPNAELARDRALRRDSQREFFLNTVGPLFKPYFQEKLPLGGRYFLTDFDRFRKNLKRSERMQKKKKAQALEGKEINRPRSSDGSQD